MDKAIPPPPPKLLLPNYQSLCLDFLKEDAVEVAREVDVPEVVQATFYVMNVSYADELGVLPVVMGEVIEEALGSLQWFSFEGWLDIHREELLSTN